MCLIVVQSCLPVLKRVTESHMKPIKRVVDKTSNHNTPLYASGYLFRYSNLRKPIANSEFTTLNFQVGSTQIHEVKA